MAKVPGKVNWFNVAKGFGFISRADGEGDVFVHQSDLHSEGFRSLREGEEVEFCIEANAEDGRAKAVNVTGPEGGFVQGAPRRVGGRGGGRGGRGRSRGGAGGGRGGGRGRGEERGPDGEVRVEESSGLQVVVLNLPWSVTWQSLKDHFQEIGNVVRADVVFDDNGRSRGFGTISYETPDEVNAAIDRFNNTELEGRTINVRLDRYG
mmetsp:Transcript_6831/g.9265  ORF Transcript_6831/g.9265 Transcript_6831/m.9265 type:complete len:207 (+) Transcript_6831:256-876(+)|eukprot:CAMPEP_0196584246 /NCGR_PEP_ID=MMETSP1081-20130531/46338_1 /TAXON_ID=36882 /ORGANISM="Pyramimonas amylifera, Strain CCMP720" /LENGTH=206 /DNA_ID=CAMNT_0041905385 /DNA_START=250 /DNA_END=870 /DNA_ORIENTATION=+